MCTALTASQVLIKPQQSSKVGTIIIISIL